MLVDGVISLLEVLIVPVIHHHSLMVHDVMMVDGMIDGASKWSPTSGRQMNQQAVDLRTSNRQVYQLAVSFSSGFRILG